MHRTWHGVRVSEILATLRDNGVSVRKMTQMSGANRSTIYRWMSGGDGQPDYDLVTRLARAIWRQHPDLARELVEASGYAWAEPDPDSEPEPAISPALLEAIRKEVDPADQERVIDALERTLRGGPPPNEPQRAAGESSAGQPSEELAAS